jgi:hypothetical protein
MRDSSKRGGHRWCFGDLVGTFPRLPLARRGSLAFHVVPASVLSNLHFKILYLYHFVLPRPSVPSSSSRRRVHASNQPLEQSLGDVTIANKYVRAVWRRLVLVIFNLAAN